MTSPSAPIVPFIASVTVGQAPAVGVPPALVGVAVATPVDVGRGVPPEEVPTGVGMPAVPDPRVAVATGVPDTAVEGETGVPLPAVGVAPGGPGVGGAPAAE